MRLIASVAVTLLAAAALFGVGWMAGRDRERAAHRTAQELVRQAAEAIDAKTAERIAGIRVTHQTITGQVREVIRESPVYRDCELPGDMQRLLEAAREGRAERAPGGGSVPAPGPGAP